MAKIHFKTMSLHQSLALPGFPTEKSLIPTKFKGLKLSAEEGSMWVEIEADGKKGMFPITNVNAATPMAEEKTKAKS